MGHTWKSLFDPRRHTDHKVAGVAYVACMAYHAYLLYFDIAKLEDGFFPHYAAPLLGLFVNLSAIRNFRHLSKSKENPGMFAKGRTFSHNFVIENFWFQLLGLAVMTFQHPPTRRVLGPWGGFIVIMGTYYIRELFPKTSYVSWDQGNKDLNEKRLRSRPVVWLISAQVKLVRWNFVFKKYYCMYLALLTCMEDVVGVPVGTYLPLAERRVTYLLTLDVMHNVTTAFFLQTLKFHHYISPATFSVLFNVTPAITFFITAYTALFVHHHIYPFLVAMATDMMCNLYIFYPSKLSPVWKNRCSTSVKVGVFIAAYLILRNDPLSWISEAPLIHLGGHGAVAL